MVGRAKSHLETNSIPARDHGGLKQTSCATGARDLTETEAELEDDGSALLRDGPPVAHIAAHQARDGVEALHLKLVLHAAVGLAEPHHRPADLEVLREVLPLAGQDEVSRAGQRITNQEVTISPHEVF